MGKPPDITITALPSWNLYVLKSAGEAVEEIYKHASATSETARKWYWDSIKSKRFASFGVRMLSYLLLVGGAVLPILAGLSGDAETRLRCTQIGVASLAVAGLLQAGDRIFGWSTGWLRYITTVTSMESATRRFELDWSNYLLAKPTPIGEDDKRPLFDLAKQFQLEIAKLQSDETDKWVTEFNTSLATLNDLIRSQRESTEKTVEAARATVAAKDAAEAAEERSKRPGGIELKITSKIDPPRVTIAVDDGAPVAFTGSTWSVLGLTPTLHTFTVTTTDPNPQTVRRSAKIPPDDIAHLDIAIP